MNGNKKKFKMVIGYNDSEILGEFKTKKEFVDYCKENHKEAMIGRLYQIFTLVNNDWILNLED